MEPDTGALSTLVNKSTSKTITRDASTKLQYSDPQLQTYTGYLVEIATGNYNCSSQIW